MAAADGRWTRNCGPCGQVICAEVAGNWNVCMCQCHNFSRFGWSQLPSEMRAEVYRLQRQNQREHGLFAFGKREVKAGKEYT